MDTEGIRLSINFDEMAHLPSKKKSGYEKRERLRRTVDD